MNCQDFESIILGMARAQLLEASARRQTIAHIAGCPACADKFAEQQELTAAVRATAKSLANEGASAQVEQSLRQAFRERTVTNVRPAFGFLTAWKWQWPKPALLATAAAILFLVFAGVIWRWSSADNGQETAITPHLPSAPARKDPDNLPKPFAPTNQPELRQQIASGRRRTVRGAKASPTIREEVTTDFIALANENELVPLESGQVLRVELPTSTLISMGLPITAEDVSKPILADLLVGQDGMARAIRFVRPGEPANGGLPQPSNNK